MLISAPVFKYEEDIDYQITNNVFYSLFYYLHFYCLA